MLVAPLPKLDRSSNPTRASPYIENLVGQRGHACESPSVADPNSKRRTLSNRVDCRLQEGICATPHNDLPRRIPCARTAALFYFAKILQSLQNGLTRRGSRRSAVFVGGWAKTCGRDENYRIALGNRCLPVVEPNDPPGPPQPPNLSGLSRRTLFYATLRPGRLDPRPTGRLCSAESLLRQDP